MGLTAVGGTLSVVGGTSPQLDVGVGGLLSVEIGADGWYADLTFVGQATGGTYDLGLAGASNHDPAATTPRLVLTVTSPGYDDTGALTTIGRTVYGTKQVRKPYPSFAQNQESPVNADDVKVRVALSEYVFAGDVVSVQVLPGLYTVGGVASSGGTLTPPNSSTTAHPKVVGNWSWPGREKVGATIAPRFVAFHRSGQQGRPVRAVRFTATGDTSGVSVSQVVTVPTYDAAMADAVPVVEYVGSLSTTTLTQGELVTLRVEAFPWIGDAGSVLDTSTGAASPSPLYGPRKVLCDKTGGYAPSYAVVDPVGGNDGTGTVKTGAVVGTTAYASVFAAMNAVRTYNSSNYGRASKGGSVIYLRTGSHTWTGGTVTADTVPAETWLTVEGYPGDARSGITVDASSGSRAPGVYTKVKGVKIAQNTATGIFSTAAGSQYWFDQCEFDIGNSGSVLVTVASGASIWHATRNLVTGLRQGFRGNSTSNMPCALIRGNTWAGDTLQPSLVYTCLGNLKTGTTGNTGAAFTDTVTGSTAPSTDGLVFAFNKWTFSAGTSPFAAFGQTVSKPIGMAVVQNLIEQVANTSQPLLQLASDGSKDNPVNNVIVWHNVITGQRSNFAYDEIAPDNITPVAPTPRYLWSVKNNIADDMNTKHDVFEGPDLSGVKYKANGGKVGAWPVLYGVGHSGNLFAETVAIGAPGTFAHEFPGIKSRQGDNVLTRGGAGDINVGSTATGYVQFVSRAAFDGTTAGAGGGSYALQSGSPAKGLARDWLLPFDLAGAARVGAGDPGAYG